jgi:hypothetical protein
MIRNGAFDITSFVAERSATWKGIDHAAQVCLPSWKSGAPICSNSMYFAWLIAGSKSGEKVDASSGAKVFRALAFETESVRKIQIVSVVTR